MQLKLYFGGTLCIFSARMAKIHIQTFNGNGCTLWIILQDVWPHQSEYSCSWDIPGGIVAKKMKAAHKGPDSAHGAPLQAASHMSTFV